MEQASLNRIRVKKVKLPEMESLLKCTQIVATNCIQIYDKDLILIGFTYLGQKI